MEKDTKAGLAAAAVLGAVAAFAPPVLPGTEPVLFVEHLAVGAGSVATYALVDRD
jgi:hypothetical protein